MICKLHNDKAKLCESHIIPKFVYDWMKETGSGRFRQFKTKNLPIQDGIKVQMLCKDCENKFSKYEKWFSENIFLPYLGDNEIVVENKIELKYFIISILWRILKLFKDDGTEYNFKIELDEAELEWRNYLLDGKPLKKYKNQHFILIDSTYWITKESDLYFSRSVDIDIVESETICIIYAKFSRFILIGEITGIKENDFENTNIDFETEFCNKNQIIVDLNDFFESRFKYCTSYENLSEKQKMKNDNYYNKEKMLNIKDTDYIKILNKYK